MPNEPLNAVGNYVLVGVDVSLYQLAPAGTDTNNSIGTYSNFLGTWKSINLTVMQPNAQVKPSAQLLYERRFIGLDWKATLKHQIRAITGPVATALVINGAPSLLAAEWQDGAGGLWQIVGGIETSEAQRDENEGMETVELVNFGYYNGGASIAYTPPS